MGAFSSAIGTISPLAGIGADISSEKHLEKQRLNALHQRMRQIEDQNREKNINEMSRLNKNLSHNLAVQAARGGGSAGLTPFNVMSMSDINNFAKDESIMDMNKVFQDEASVTEEQNIRDKYRVGMVSDITSTAMNTAKAFANMYIPTQSPTTDLTQDKAFNSVNNDMSTDNWEKYARQELEI